MGKFSRNTFDASKHYVGVRLKQGVPLVDADWNELNDIIRQEIYDSFAALLGNDFYVPPKYQDAFAVTYAKDTSDLQISAGRAFVEGRLIAVGQCQFNLQQWADPETASKAGVNVIERFAPRRKALPGQTSGSRDVLYLDIWEQEIDSKVDPNIVNPDIGIETCVRLKRESCYRLALDQDTPPAPPQGHVYGSLAYLNYSSASDAHTHEVFLFLEDIKRVY